MQEPPGLAETFAALRTAVILIGPEGRIERINPATEALLNISASHLKGQMLADVLTLPRKFDAGGDEPFAAYDVAISTARGGKLVVDIEVSQFGDHPGWRLMTLHGGAAAHRLGHRERNNGTRSAVGVAAMLAHEIKNPLSGIRGAAQLIEARLGEEDRVMTSLIRTEVDRVAALLDQMEGFTDTRRAPLAVENVHSIIDHARAVARSGFGSRLTIRDAFDPSLPPVLVHRDALVQILINLLKNAAETIDSEGTREVLLTTAYRQGVSVSRQGGEGKQALPIELCVMDDGPGIPDDLVDDVFQPFVTTKPSGRGLGLALADKLIRDMDGLIRYSREGSPPWTVFRILLPRAKPARGT